MSTPPLSPRPREYRQKKVKVEPEELPKTFLTGEHTELKITNEQKFPVYYNIELPQGIECDFEEGQIESMRSQKVTLRIYDQSIVCRENKPILNVFFQKKRTFPTFWVILDVEKEDYESALSNDWWDHDPYESCAKILNKVGKDEDYMRHLETNDPEAHCKMQYLLGWTMDDVGLRRAIAAAHYVRNPEEKKVYEQKQADLRALGAKIAAASLESAEVKQHLKENQPEAFKKFRRCVKGDKRKPPMPSQQF